jgi:hypothetical protein
MASGGVYAQAGSGTWLFWIQDYFLVATLWLLLGIPHRAFKFGLDLSGDGTAQELMLSWFAGLASALTGFSIIMLHPGGGPLAQVNVKTLLVGVTFTCFLIYPLFKALARACWKRGITGVLSPRSLFERWHKAALELGMAYHVYYTEKFAQEDRAMRKLRNDSVKGKADGAKAQPARNHRVSNASRVDRHPKKKRRSGPKRPRPAKR